jgi:SAM-dependent methyltransferase
VKCRHCGATLQLPLVDLGSAPLSNAYLTREQLHAPEKWYPLRVLVCESCWLAQTEEYLEADEFFTDTYAYFSSVSETWLGHARLYVANMVDRFELGPSSLVAEIAANDGYLLQYVRERGISCYGIEPTNSTAAAARAKGIEIIEEFFGKAVAGWLVEEGRQADLIVANNVLAHVPDINDFVAGIATLLKPNGIATCEFPSLLNLVREGVFDTIYHEHYSYLSLTTVERIFRSNGLIVVDVEQWPTHGGSLRVFARRQDAVDVSVAAVVPTMLRVEIDAGITTPALYDGFQARVNSIKDDLIEFLLAQKRAGKKVGAYGAAAKGNTLLNFGGVRADLLPYVVDRSPGKQGKYLPGSRIPIVEEAHLYANKPDWVLILPWNIRPEIERQLSAVREWGGKFVQAVPRLEFS